MRGKAAFRALAVSLCVVGLMSGCAKNNVVERNYDPLIKLNRTFYTVNDTIDKKFAEPVARGYKFVVPKPIRRGVTNFFDNAAYPNTIFNDILQGKMLQALGDSGRFLLNTTLGWGGIFDPATHVGLKKNHEDFGQTLAVWGFAQGPYLVLPMQGSDTLRNAPNYVSQALLNPFYWVTTTVSLPVGFLAAINNRANLLEATKIRDEAALDPYVFTREAYLQKLLYEIYDGHPPSNQVDESMPESVKTGQDKGVLRVF